MIVQDLLGWFALAIIISGTLLFSKKYPHAKNFLLIALFLRSVCVIFDHYFTPLPDSLGDASAFEKKAYFYSENYGLNIFTVSIFQDSSYFISKFISIFYTLLERSPLLAKMLSVGFGTGSVLLIYNLAFIIWDKKIALKAGWIAAIFPSFILYSSLILREVYVVFFLTYALIGCMKFISKENFISLIQATLGFLMAGLFHGPIFLGLFVFLSIVCLKTIKENNFFIRFKKKNLYYIFLLPLFLIPIISYFLGNYAIPKLGNFKDFSIKNENNKIISTTLEKKIIWKINKATRASNDNPLGASFPKWTIPNDSKEIVFLVPIRMLYFLYSPFPWDIKKTIHIIGLIDALFYVYITYCIIRNKKKLFNNHQTIILIAILFSYVFIYSFGVGNFGTGIRHRIKFIGILIVLAGQKIPKFKIT